MTLLKQLLVFCYEMPRCQNVTKLQIDNRSLNVALKQKVEHFALQITMGLLRIASEVEGKRPIDNILNYVNSYTDSNMVKIHCTDTGETVSSSVTALLFYPVLLRDGADGGGLHPRGEP